MLSYLDASIEYMNYKEQSARISEVLILSLLGVVLMDKETATIKVPTTLLKLLESAKYIKPLSDKDMLGNLNQPHLFEMEIKMIPFSGYEPLEDLL